MTYDLIIVAASTHSDLVRYTQQAINTARADTENINVILIETSNKEINYSGVDRIIRYEGDFNYNRALNMGLNHRNSEIQILANNDIIFRPGWSKIGGLMRANGYLSACALSADIRQRPFRRGVLAYEGYTVGFELAGWCIFTDKAIWDKIGKLSEKHDFWYSDNVYAAQLKKAKITHALLCNIQVDHIGSQTLNRIDSRKRIQYTYAEAKRIRKADPEDL